MATTKVTRLDQYPAENPTGWAVGFTVTTDNNRSFYRDTVISFTDADSDNLAIDLAYGRLRNKIWNLTRSYENQGSRLGLEYTDRVAPPINPSDFIRQLDQSQRPPNDPEPELPAGPPTEEASE